MPDPGNGFRPALRAAGEGALLGLLAGLVLGAWEVRLGEDLLHGFGGLAALRILGPAAILGLSGALASLLLHLLLGLAARMGPAATVAAGSLVGLFLLVQIYEALGPQRETFFPMSKFSSPSLTMACMGLVMAAALALLCLRFLDVWSGLPKGMRLDSLRTLLAGTGGVALLGIVVAWLAWPVFLASRASSRKAPSVILISLDTLRADRLGSMGYERSLTPNLDRLAEEGMVFEQASSAAPWTLPSHVSVFTSMLPFDHHIRWSWMRVHPLKSLLGEHFRNAGYRTGGFTGGGYVSSNFNFSQGFQIWEDHNEILDDGPQRIMDSALDWVRNGGEQPFLLFLHTYEPHSPYEHREFADPATAGRMPDVITFDVVSAIQNQVLIPDEDERRYVRDLYDGDIAYTDRIVGGFLDTLREEGILDRAIVVVFSDHGEDLWDHSEIRSPGHGHSLYEELIHVPLLVRAPGLVPAGSRIKAPVSLIDLAPTLLELALLPEDRSHRGRSLASTWKTGEEPEVIPVRAESVEYGPDRFSYRLQDHKAVMTPLPEKAHHNIDLVVEPLELFNLAADPLEANRLLTDELQEFSEMVLALQERAQEKLLAHEGETGTEKDLPEALQRQLRALGYID